MSETNWRKCCASFEGTPHMVKCSFFGEWAVAEIASLRTALAAALSKREVPAEWVEAVKRAYEVVKIAEQEHWKHEAAPSHSCCLDPNDRDPLVKSRYELEALIFPAQPIEGGKPCMAENHADPDHDHCSFRPAKPEGGKL
jgi:hypothetical protein